MSETTAIRTPSNLAACRSQWPPLPRGRVARVPRGDSSPGRRDDEPMALEPWGIDRTDLDRPATERLDGPFCGTELGLEFAALPGEQDASACEQREAKLDELAKTGDRSDRDRRPLTA